VGAGGEHLPIHDGTHVLNAIARFWQTHFESAAVEARAAKAVVAAAKAIVAAAKRHDIEIDADDEVAAAAR